MTLDCLYKVIVIYTINLIHQFLIVFSSIKMKPLILNWTFSIKKERNTNIICINLMLYLDQFILHKKKKLLFWYLKINCV